LVILFLSLDRQRGVRGDFIKIILKSPFIPLCQKGEIFLLPLEKGGGEGFRRGISKS